MVLSMDRWVGKVAIVTGASAGIGAVVAEKLVEAGVVVTINHCNHQKINKKVAGFARRAEKIQNLAKKLENKKGKLHAIKVDISKEDDILEGFKWVSENLGPVHILINNAGIIQHTNLVCGDTEKWKRTFDINVLGLCIATREAVSIMKTHGINGHIVHINSISGHMITTFPNLNVYPASKHAVTALTETLRQELNRFNLKIKVTSISPGAVLTDIYKVNAWNRDFLTDEVNSQRPILKSEDVADAVMYVLATPPHVQVHEMIMKAVGA